MFYDNSPSSIHLITPKPAACDTTYYRTISIDIVDARGLEAAAQYIDITYIYNMNIWSEVYLSPFLSKINPHPSNPGLFDTLCTFEMARSYPNSKRYAIIC